MLSAMRWYKRTTPGGLWPADKLECCQRTHSICATVYCTHTYREVSVSEHVLRAPHNLPSAFGVEKQCWHFLLASLSSPVSHTSFVMWKTGLAGLRSLETDTESSMIMAERKKEDEEEEKMKKITS